MALKPTVGLRQSQRLVLSPRMHQSLALLRLPTESLVDEIAREAEDNPFLVVETASPGTSAYDVALATTAAPESLGERLRRQIALQHLDPVTEAAALFLIAELREDGYLDEEISEIATRTSLSEELLEPGLIALQNCEPAGIGARTLAECLALQLIGAGIDRDIAFAATARLDDFAEDRWDRLGRHLPVGRDEIKRIARLLRGFSSSPVSPAGDVSSPLIPELLVERGDHDRISVQLLPSALPRITVMSVSRGTLGSEKLRSLYDRAGHFAVGLSARSETLLRIGNYIAATQAAFFLGDHDTIAPVTRSEAAAALAMHPSTLGRAVSGKALIADNRLYPLSLFFARALPGADGAVSPFDIQRRMKEIISAETTDSPLADEAISAQLRKEGVDIARRTVAKYRKCMRIPSSFGRKRRKVSRQSQPQDQRKAN